MSDGELRAALRSLTEEDIPFILDLLERLSGKAWHEEHSNIPTIEHLLVHTFYGSVNDLITGRYRGKTATVVNSPRAHHQIAKLLRDQLI